MMAQTKTVLLDLALALLLLSLINFKIVNADFSDIDQPPNDNVDEFDSRGAGPVFGTGVSKGFRNWMLRWLEGGDIADLVEMATLPRRLLVGIEKILNFFEQHSDELLVDALLGIKISNEQLNETLHQIPEEETLLASAIRKLINKGRKIMEVAVPNTRQRFEDFEVIGGVLKVHMNWPMVTKSLPPVVELQSEKDDNKVSPECLSPFRTDTESLSDHCISQLFPDERLADTTSARCQLDDECIQRVFLSCHGYDLTHQLLYLMIGIKSECSQVLADRLREMAPSSVQKQQTIESIIDGFCLDIYRESLNISAAGFPLNKRDLFIEQAVLCGLLNYIDFFRQDWVAINLSWQQPQGCYNYRDADSDAATGKSVFHRRVKRRELTFEDGCSSHRTGLAVAYFSVLLRHITSAI
ncbi:UPF0764 protein C16orf89 homolog [Lytechinus variegatus]|uniref:UPF0764 protein C16orf89 homolog n=1 Tax=Lytechinus variegatus TaxID=7654 RepID=UPI001BB27F94|nr:UPF0764 protein C16orf89 homolog [Lytechinus variegatus]